MKRRNYTLPKGPLLIGVMMKGVSSGIVNTRSGLRQSSVVFHGDSVKSSHILILTVY